MHVGCATCINHFSRDFGIKRCMIPFLQHPTLEDDTSENVHDKVMKYEVYFTRELKK